MSNRYKWNNESITSVSPFHRKFNVSTIPPYRDTEAERLLSENNEYFNKTYGVTKYTPFEPYVPDNSFMKTLEKKEQDIKNKYTSKK
jgi:hypothetical protein